MFPGNAFASTKTLRSIFIFRKLIIASPLWQADGICSTNIRRTFVYGCTKEAGLKPCLIKTAGGYYRQMISGRWVIKDVRKKVALPAPVPPYGRIIGIKKRLLPHHGGIVSAV